MRQSVPHSNDKLRLLINPYSVDGKPDPSFQHPMKTGQKQSAENPGVEKYIFTVSGRCFSKNRYVQKITLTKPNILVMLFKVNN